MKAYGCQHRAKLRRIRQVLVRVAFEEALQQWRLDIPLFVEDDPAQDTLSRTAWSSSANRNRADPRVHPSFFGFSSEGQRLL